MVMWLNMTSFNRIGSEEGGELKNLTINAIEK